MTTQEKITLAEQAGLVFNEFDEDDQPEFIGTQEKWKKYLQMCHEMEMGDYYSS